MFEFNATFIVAIFSFTVFIMIMNAIFYRPILNIIRKRENYISSNYEDSKRFEADANEYKTTHAAKIEQTQEKCRHEFKKAVEKAQNKATDKVKMAKENSKFEIMQKKEKILQEESKLKQEVKHTVVKDLASSIASKILGIDTKIENTDYEPVNRVMD